MMNIAYKSLNIFSIYLNQSSIWWFILSWINIDYSHHGDKNYHNLLI